MKGKVLLILLDTTCTDELFSLMFYSCNIGYLMDVGDKIWMDLRRSTDEYIHGVNDFLDKAFERAFQGDEILCPCKKCFNRYWHCLNVVEDHLIWHGFVHGYTKWVFHGKGFSSRNTPHPTNDDEISTGKTVLINYFKILLEMSKMT